MEKTCRKAEEYLKIIKEIYNISNKEKEEQPRDNYEKDEEDSSFYLGYYKNELNYESKRANNLKNDDINNVNNTNDVIYDYNTNNQNYDEYSLNAMVNSENFNNTNIIQDNEIYNFDINYGTNQQGINEAIYESDVKTIPIIIGQSEVNYGPNNEVLDYDNNLIQQNNIQENLHEDRGYIKNTQMDNYTQLNPEENYTHITSQENYTNLNQGENYTQLNQEENYTQLNQEENYTQLNQEENYTQLNPPENHIQLNQRENYTQLNVAQNYTTSNPIIGFSRRGRYKVKTFETKNRMSTNNLPQSYIQLNQTMSYLTTSYVPLYNQQINRLKAEYNFTPINQTRSSAIFSSNNSQIIKSSSPYKKKYYHVKLGLKK